MGGNSTLEMSEETGIDMRQACWLKDGNSEFRLSAMKPTAIEALSARHGAWLKGVRDEEERVR
jgi:hypothetical protein